MFSWASIYKSVLINEGWKRLKMSMSWGVTRTHKYQVKLVFGSVDSLGDVILEGFGKTLCLKIVWLGVNFKLIYLIFIKNLRVVDHSLLRHWSLGGGSTKHFGIVWTRRSSYIMTHKNILRCPPTCAITPRIIFLLYPQFTVASTTTEGMYHINYFDNEQH